MPYLLKINAMKSSSTIDLEETLNATVVHDKVKVFPGVASPRADASVEEMIIQGGNKGSTDEGEPKSAIDNGTHSS